MGKDWKKTEKRMEKDWKSQLQLVFRDFLLIFIFYKPDVAKISPFWVKISPFSIEKKIDQNKLNYSLIRHFRSNFISFSILFQ